MRSFLQNIVLILKVLMEMKDLMEKHFEERRLAANQQRWLDSATVKLMLRVSDRTLFEYVKKGKLICDKRGGVNFYLEETVLKLMTGKNMLFRRDN